MRDWLNAGTGQSNRRVITIDKRETDTRITIQWWETRAWDYSLSTSRHLEYKFVIEREGLDQALDALSKWCAKAI